MIKNSAWLHGLFLLVLSCSPLMAQGEPWLDLTARSLDPSHYLRETELPYAVLPNRVVTLESRALTFVLDRSSAEIHVLDQHYEHSHEADCVDKTAYFGLSLDGWPECSRTQVKVNRGVLRHDDGIVALAVQEDPGDSTVAPLVFAVTTTGWAYVIDADARTPHPLDYLYLDPAAGTRLRTPAGAALSFTANTVAAYDLAAADLWVIDGVDRYSFHFDGSGFAPGSVSPLSGNARDLVIARGAPYALTSVGVEAPGIPTLFVPGARMVTDDDYLWITRPTADQVVRIDLTTPSIAAMPVPGCAAPLAVDPAGDRLYVATKRSVVIFDATSFGAPELDRQAHLRPVALAATSTHELVVVHSNIGPGTPSGTPPFSAKIFFDEESLDNGQAPLFMTNQIFIEHPRDEDPEAPDCDTVAASHGAPLAANNRLLEDLPGEFAIAMIPQAAAVLAACEATAADLEDLWNDGTRHTGVLFHDREVCTAEDYESMLTEQFEMLAAATKSATFFSGIEPHADFGCNWIDGLLAIGAPERYLFFGLGVTEIEQGDIRSKDSFPLHVGDQSRPWIADDFTNAGDDTGATAGIIMVPGDNVPAFNLAGCENLFLFECYDVSSSYGYEISAEDVAILELLVRRSMAVRSGQDDHWSFHWPDVANWDYTSSLGADMAVVENCDETGDIWSTVAGAPDCEAELFQQFFFDLHARFELNELLQWVAPQLIGP